MHTTSPRSISQTLQQATELHLQGRLAEAERAYTEILAQEPTQFVALHRLAVVALQQGRHEEALRRVEAALKVDPGAEPALINKGTILLALRRHDDALAEYGRVLLSNPNNADAHFNVGNALMEAGRAIEAAASFARVVSLRSGDHEARLREAGALAQAGRLEEAIARLGRAAELAPTVLPLQHERARLMTQLGLHAEAVDAYDRILAQHGADTVALNNRGLALFELGRANEALASFDAAVALKPHDLDLWYNRGRVLTRLGRTEAALESYERVLAVDPCNVPSLIARGNSLRVLGRTAEALADYQTATEFAPDDAGAHTSLGNALRVLRQFEASLAAHERALALRPKLVEALVNRGITLQDLGRMEEAIASYDAALAINHDHAEALYNRGLALALVNRHEDARASHAAALRAEPGHRHALGALADAALHTCAWVETAWLASELERHVREHRSLVTPFTLIGYTDRPEVQLEATRAYITDRFPHPLPPLCEATLYCQPKLRIAYLSADFQRHATAFLMAELFELHDRSRFEVIGVSWGADDGSATRARLAKAFDHFLDVARLSDLDVARWLRGAEVAIAIDLKGHTGNNRIGILAHRPTPIQIAYMGYPATMGCSFIDYVLADPVVLPLAEQPHWTERIVHLPDSYQCNDRQRPLPSQGPTRAELGLPQRGFVFCSFNNSWKITPTVFDVWMRLLRDVEGSVLWLLDDNSTATHYLRREAEARGIAPERLVFSARVEPAAHLARHWAVDLFLDTLPCNAHTTASDALWMGVPLVSCAGHSFAGRVAASLLNAIGVPELVTTNLQDYEALARRLAADPAALQRIKVRLDANRRTAPLFNTHRLCRNIEAAYLKMWELHQRGQRPQSFAVGEVTGDAP